MIMSSDGEWTFMYRVGAIAVHDGRLLVEHNLKHKFCFVPGGRVEYGETAVVALTRELREEVGEDVQVGRLVLTTDNLFEFEGRRYQEIALYFHVDFASDSGILGRQGKFEANEVGVVFEWILLSEVETANLFPTFLRVRVNAVSQVPDYVAHSSL